MKKNNTYNNKNEINILFLKDINFFIPDENIKYIVKIKDELIELQDLPIIYKNHLSILYNYLAYDYDELNTYYKDKYKYLYKKIKKINDNFFKFDTKTYKKIRNN